jgi:carbon-monoxide dehydrogenase catalytic subunit
LPKKAPKTDQDAAAKTRLDPAALSVDPSTRDMIAKSLEDGVSTCFDRVQEQKKPCAFGAKGLCCRNCHMGPCRITAKSPRGVCGADADAIVARNFLREVASGAAAHSDHGRRLALLLRQAGEGGGDYDVRDPAALHRVAQELEVDSDGLDLGELAVAVADAMLDQFKLQEEELSLLSLAPVARQSIWRKENVAPSGIDRMVVESMHRSHIGVDHEATSVLDHAMRTSLSDGWGGSRLATMASDILFGTPMPVKSTANLGVLREDTVNVVVHGHEPALSEMLAAVSRDPEVLERAEKAGAKGLTLAGICCTANEVLMRHGIPVAGNFLQQELAIVTGAVEMMITDVQCVMASLPEVARSYHTTVVSTSELARTPGAEHHPFDHKQARECAKKLLLQAIDNFGARDPKRVNIPGRTSPLVAGFSTPAIKHMLGGRLRASFRPLNDAVMQGRIKGVAGIVGCNNPRACHDSYINTMTRELLANDVLVIKTGCAALASAKAGLLSPESAMDMAGPGLREVCEAVGMPPVLHMGSCVDNSRILEAAAEIVAEGGLGEDLSDLPVAGAAPEWMSEKAVSIGCYCVASGVDVVLGRPFHTSGSEAVEQYLTEGRRRRFGAAFHTEEDPAQGAKRMLEIIEGRRKKLGLDIKAERKLLDMKDRRKLGV